MGYATKQDLIDRYGEAELVQITDRTNQPQTTVDDDAVGRALDDATGLMDGYFAKVATLPLSVVPAVATDVCSRIARYRLWPEGLTKESKVATDYRDAIAWLKDVAAGTVSLDAGGSAPTPASGGVRLTAATQVFSRDSLKGM